MVDVADMSVKFYKAVIQLRGGVFANKLVCYDS